MVKKCRVDLLPREDQEAICGPEFAMGGWKKRERESNLCSSPES